MKNWFVLLMAAAAMTAFAPSASNAQIAIDTPVGGVRIGEPPRHEEHVIVKERHEGPAVEMREREVRGTRDCDTKTVHESGPGGSETRTSTRCD